MAAKQPLVIDNTEQDSLEAVRQIGKNYEENYGWHDDIEYDIMLKGLTEDTIREIVRIRDEPAWMEQFRLRALKHFMERPTPTWGVDLSKLKFDDYYYYTNPKGKQAAKTWEEMAPTIRRTFERLGIPEAERNFLAGVGAIYESTEVYNSLQKHLEKQGVLFTTISRAVKEYPDLIKQYMGRIVPISDNKFAALNSAIFSDGSFIYVPRGVKITSPIEAYFRMNSKSSVQAERTLIIAEPDSEVSYLEGCTASVSTGASIHAAVVELLAKERAKINYMTMQNWDKSVYNLVTKRSHALEDAAIRWVNCETGCLPAETKIMSNPGVKSIVDVKVGDKVISYIDGELKPRTVTGTMFSGIKPVFRIVLDNGAREIEATTNHRFLVLKHEADKPRKLGRYSYEWRALGDLSAGDMLLSPLELPNLGKSHAFNMPKDNYEMKIGNQWGRGFTAKRRYKIKIHLPRSSNPAIMWLLGVYMGDGYVSIKKGRNQVGFAVPPTDPIYKKTLQELKNQFGLKHLSKAKYEILCNSKSLGEWLHSEGFVGDTYTKRVPQWVFTLPIEEKAAFIAGYAESDGRIAEGIRLKSCNRELIEDMKMLSMSCGLEVNKISTLTETESILGQPRKEYTSYVTYLSGLRPIIPYMVPSHRKTIIFLNRNSHVMFHNKYRVRVPDNMGIFPITGISPCGKKPVFDIEVEGAHNFVAEGIIVHNSGHNMKYPSIYLLGKRSRGEIYSMAYAAHGQVQDTGGKILFYAPDTKGKIISKSVSKDDGLTVYRGLIKIDKRADRAQVISRCDALLLGEEARTATYPYNEIDSETAEVSHEASVGKVGQDQLFYLMSRGISEQEALSMIVNGFIEPIVKEMPLMYSVEFTRLMNLEMTGSVG